MTNARTRAPQLRGGEGDPRPIGSVRYGVVPIVTAEVHEAWCAWAYQTRDGRRGDLAFCAGCGWYVRVKLGAVTIPH